MPRIQVSFPSFFHAKTYLTLSKFPPFPTNARRNMYWHECTETESSPISSDRWLLWSSWYWGSSLEDRSKVYLSLCLHRFSLNPEGHTMPPLNSEIYSNATFLFSYLQDVHILLHKPWQKQSNCQESNGHWYHWLNCYSWWSAVSPWVCRLMILFQCHSMVSLVARQRLPMLPIRCCCAWGRTWGRCNKAALKLQWSGVDHHYWPLLGDPRPSPPI